MKRRFSRFLFFVVLISSMGVVALTGCRDDDFNTSPDVRLSFSTDSIMFDTVFNTVGSATQILTVYNNEDSYVNINRIKLNNDPNNSYRINVDGLAGDDLSDIEIGPEDSIFVFIEVTVNPDQDQLYPFVEGAIEFTTNGNQQDVDLVAWGWDAIFYTPTTFPENGLPDFTVIDTTSNSTFTWTAEKPIVIYGYLVIDSTQTLNVEPGTEVFFHQGAGLWIYRGGNIQAEGTLEEPITFQGDRLEPFYDEEPGQWDRIWINEGSTDNVLENVLIKNNFIGLQVETLPFSYNIDAPTSANKLIMKNVVIRNNSLAGIFSTNYRIDAENVLLSNAGEYLLAGTGGGEYKFDHCTFANNWSISTRQTPSLFLSNLVQVGPSTVQIREIENSEFRNCIVYGNSLNELGLDFDTEQAAVDLTFESCLIRAEEEEVAPFIDDYFGPGNFVGNEPGFQDFPGGNFMLTENAFARGNGGSYSALPLNDLIGTPYNTPRPIGCFEYLPE